ncbi:hypothetical protein, partial [Methylocapsa sp. S129]|uniref:hypothetical protein n=1 Tax=Methylocapsa sp. S129 TaxID=1641869 RepID=UPI001AEEBF33
HALMMIAAIEANGERQIMFVGDTGCFPDTALAQAVKAIATKREIEFHIHLLATSRAGREAVIIDLSQARRS